MDAEEETNSLKGELANLKEATHDKLKVLKLYNENGTLLENIVELDKEKENILAHNGQVDVAEKAKEDFEEMRVAWPTTSRTRHCGAKPQRSAKQTSYCRASSPRSNLSVDDDGDDGSALADRPAVHATSC